MSLGPSIAEVREVLRARWLASQGTHDASPPAPELAMAVNTEEDPKCPVCLATADEVSGGFRPIFCGHPICVVCYPGVCNSGYSRCPMCRDSVGWPQRPQQLVNDEDDDETEDENNLVEELLAEQARLHTKLARIGAKVERIDAERKRLHAELVQANRTIAKNRADLDRRDAEIERLDTENKEQRNELKRVRTEHADNINKKQRFEQDRRSD